jgi:hypothetical protein
MTTRTICRSHLIDQIGPTLDQDSTVIKGTCIVNVINAYAQTFRRTLHYRRGENLTTWKSSRPDISYAVHMCDTHPTWSMDKQSSGSEGTSREPGTRAASSDHRMSRCYLGRRRLVEANAETAMDETAGTLTVRIHHLGDR